MSLSGDVLEGDEASGDDCVLSGEFLQHAYWVGRSRRSWHDYPFLCARVEPMLLNAYYWKSELLGLSEEIKRYSAFAENEELDYPDVPYCMLRLERALLYSAFAIRLLYESEKLTDRMKGYNLSVEEIPNIVEDPSARLPLFRKFATHDNYDFSARKRVTISGLQLTNQLIHSHVALSFKYEESKAVGFYVSSDRTVDDLLYYCVLADWLRFLSAVISDEIVSLRTHYDKERGKWITQRS